MSKSNAQCGMGCPCCSQQHHTHEHKHEHEHNHEHEHGHEHSHSHASSKWLWPQVLFSVALCIAGVLTRDVQWILSMCLFALSTLVMGWQILLDGLKGLFTLHFDEETLMSIAVIAAFVINEPFEGALVTILFCLGLQFENYAANRSQKNIQDLMAICPDEANLLKPNGEMVTVKANSIQIGDTIVVRPFERVPLDCKVLSGSSSVDTSAITGESVPIQAAPNDMLLSGYINQKNALTCKATSLAQDSAAAKVVRLVEQARNQKGNTEAFITRFARIYTPLVILCALLVAVVPPLVGLGAWNVWIMRALVFLVSACPCALVISIPMAFFSGIGACSKRGVLVKGSPYIEKLANVKLIAFDKTGTLTSGKLSVSSIDSLNGEPIQKHLPYYKAILSQSTHPSAATIAAFCQQQGVEDVAMDRVEEVVGRGMKGIKGQDVYLCGSARLLAQNGIDTKGLPFANVYLAKNREVLACCVLADTVKPDAEKTIRRLYALGVEKMVMLTGDNEQSARLAAQACSIDDYHAQLLPENKLSLFEELSKSYSPTAFIGDGINDSPVIASADVGISMGLGSAAAIEASDAVLVSGSLSPLTDAIQISRRTVGIARFNIVFSLIIKIAVLVLGVFGIASMGLAIFADVGVTILCVIIAMSIFGYRTRQ